MLYLQVNVGGVYLYVVNDGQDYIVDKKDTSPIHCVPHRAKREMMGNVGGVCVLCFSFNLRNRYSTQNQLKTEHILTLLIFSIIWLVPGKKDERKCGILVIQDGGKVVVQDCTVIYHISVEKDFLLRMQHATHSAGNTINSLVCTQQSPADSYSTRCGVYKMHKGRDAITSYV